MVVSITYSVVAHTIAIQCIYCLSLICNARDTFKFLQDNEIFIFRKRSLRPIGTPNSKMLILIDRKTIDPKSFFPIWMTNT